MTIIPLTGIVFYIMICIEVGKAFGKGVGFGVCLFLFAPICWPILAFGKAQYVGAGGQSRVCPTAHGSRVSAAAAGWLSSTTRHLRHRPKASNNFTALHSEGFLVSLITKNLFCFVKRPVSARFHAWTSPRLPLPPTG
jgi:hypothetical protein